MTGPNHLNTTGLSTRTFRGVVWRVVDGDSVEILVDLDAFGEWTLRNFRLLGCNAWERNTPAGRAASEHLKGLLVRGDTVTVTSVKVDKYGARYDAVITLADGRDLATYLIANQWAAPWNGKGPAPTPPWPREVP